MPQQLTVPTGAALQQGYYPGAAHVSAGGVGRAVGPNHRLVAGPEYKPDLTVDERHCRWIEGQAQCRSWPVKNKPNPERFCAGHLKKLEAVNGAEPSGDQELRTSAP